jgi:aryl-alcohol dehydrogenase-like predicted oxidoreductase
MVDLLCRWEPLDAVAEFGASYATVALAWVLSMRGRKVGGKEHDDVLKNN